MKYKDINVTKTPFFSDGLFNSLNKSILKIHACKYFIYWKLRDINVNRSAKEKIIFIEIYVLLLKTTRSSNTCHSSSFEELLFPFAINLFLFWSHHLDSAPPVTWM
jgi:hypothetical protein